MYGLQLGLNSLNSVGQAAGILPALSQIRVHGGYGLFQSFHIGRQGLALGLYLRQFAVDIGYFFLEFFQPPGFRENLGLVLPEGSFLACNFPAEYS